MLTEESRSQKLPMTDLKLEKGFLRGPISFDLTLLQVKLEQKTLQIQ